MDANAMKNRWSALHVIETFRRASVGKKIILLVALLVALAVMLGCIAVGLGGIVLFAVIAYQCVFNLGSGCDL
jgi:hypothetical protein